MHELRIKRLKEIIAETKRFITKAEIALFALEEYSKLKYQPYNSREFAAVKRASLDLSVELSTLRKAGVFDKIKGEK